MVHGLDLEDGGGRKGVEVNATFNFRLDNAAVDFVGEVGVGVEHTSDRGLGYRVSGGGTRALWSGRAWTLEEGRVMEVAENCGGRWGRSRLLSETRRVIPNGALRSLHSSKGESS